MSSTLEIYKSLGAHKALESDLTKVLEKNFKDIYAQLTPIQQENLRPYIHNMIKLREYDLDTLKYQILGTSIPALEAEIQLIENYARKMVDAPLKEKVTMVLLPQLKQKLAEIKASAEMAITETEALTQENLKGAIDAARNPSRRTHQASKANMISGERFNNLTARFNTVEDNVADTLPKLTKELYAVTYAGLAQNDKNEIAARRAFETNQQQASTRSFQTEPTNPTQRYN